MAFRKAWLCQWRAKNEPELWVTVKEASSCFTKSTHALHVMWLIAGARSTRRLMAIHPGASRASPSPPPLTAPSGPVERERERKGEQSSAHSSWMGTLYDNHHHLPSEDNTQRSLPELDCTATRAYGANFVWRVWWEWSHAPSEAARQAAKGLPALTQLLYLSASNCLFSVCFPLVPLITCTVSLSTCCVSVPWTEAVHKWSMVTYLHCFSHLQMHIYAA